jgi:hypothetical protein
MKLASTSMKELETVLVTPNKEEKVKQLLQVLS